MAVQITEAAASHIRRTLSKENGAVALRLGVKASGCSGFEYTVGVADAVGEDDTVYEEHGAKVVVDRKSLPFLQGMEVDYIREGLNQRLEFRNPNVTASCGCGESFAIG